MNEIDSETDEIEKEYDLTKMRVRKVGSGRKLPEKIEGDELLDEYNFDYSKSKPNRFAEEYRKTFGKTEKE